MCICFFAVSFCLCGMLCFLPPKALVPCYFGMAMDMLLGWLLELNYNLYHNEIDSMSSIWWNNEGVAWWALSLGTMAFHLFICLYNYWPQEHDDTLRILGQLEKTGTLIFVIFHVFCMSGVFISISAQIFYWLSKLIIIKIGFYFNVYCWLRSSQPFRELTANEIKKALFDANFMRDMRVGFFLFHTGLCLLIDSVRMFPKTIFSLSYFGSFLADWCTTLVALTCTSLGFAFVSGLCVALCELLINGQKLSVRSVYNGTTMHVGFLITCFEAGILTNIPNNVVHHLNCAVFLIFYTILYQVSRVVENSSRHIVASSTKNGVVTSCLKSVFIVCTITFSSTYITSLAARSLKIDFWTLFNVSGNSIVLSRAFSTLFELFLGTMIWYSDRTDTIEGAIYKTRHFRLGQTAVTSMMMLYYRFFAPFFSSWFYLRLILVIYEIIRSGSFIYLEWVEVEDRRKFLSGIDTLPGVGEKGSKQHASDHHPSETMVCFVCSEAVDEGKVLQCSHSFHKACLRKSFQLRSSCPACKKPVFGLVKKTNEILADFISKNNINPLSVQTDSN